MLTYHKNLLYYGSTKNQGAKILLKSNTTKKKAINTQCKWIPTTSE